MPHKGKTILAVVPARGGSKGISRKNLKLIDGISLIGHAARICAELNCLDRAIISTDDNKMRNEGIKFGLESPFLRPKKLATDKASALDVLIHATTESEKFYKETYDIIILLEPSSPFREANHIIKTITKLINGNYDSVLTVSETDSKGHPLKQLIFNNDKVTFYKNKAKNIITRQELSKTYHRNGVAYAMTRQCLIRQKSIIGKNASAIVINQFMPNIDTNSDLEFARYLSKNN